MFAAERREAILELVRASGAVSLRDLAASVSTSEVTVRRDIRALEGKGLLDRRHGGVVWPGGLSHEQSYRQKQSIAAAEKAAIGALAAALVQEGDAIVVGAGSTTRQLALRLTRFADLTVVTTSLLVAEALAHCKADVTLTGGTLRGSTFALIGSRAEQGLAGIRVRRAFLSGNGLTFERGLSTPNMLAAGVDQAIVRAAQEVVVLADHTKLGVDTMVQTVRTDSISHLVTDDRADERLLRSFTAAGVQVHVAAVPETESPCAADGADQRRSAPTRP